jgi:hypothetical protein
MSMRGPSLLWCTVVLLACLAEACSPTELWPSFWFVFTQKPEGSYLSVQPNADFEAVRVGETRGWLRHGTLAQSEKADLEALLSREAFDRYGTHAMNDNDTCWDTGYTLHLAGVGIECFIMDDVEDAETRSMLDTMVGLLNRELPPAQ